MLTGNRVESSRVTVLNLVGFILFSLFMLSFFFFLFFSKPVDS